MPSFCSVEKDCRLPAKARAHVRDDHDLMVCPQRYDQTTHSVWSTSSRVQRVMYCTHVCPTSSFRPPPSSPPQVDPGMRHHEIWSALRFPEGGLACVSVKTEHYQTGVRGGRPVAPARHACAPLI
eukprot:48642-Eustigmatos_ZCMA.PRE.1